MWSKKYDKCIICGTIERKCFAIGMCVRCYSKDYYKKNSEKRKAQSKKRREANPEKYREQTRNWRKKNPEKTRELAKKYREEDLEKFKKRANDRYKKNIEKSREYYRNQYWKDPEKYRKRAKINSARYRKENLEKVKKSIYRCNSKRLLTDPRFRLKCNISRSLSARLRKRLSSKKGKSTWDFLPYTVDELISHLESLFTKGMTWDNYGRFGWHIDHKKPESLFNYKNVEDEEFQKCWALKNLQPLWWFDNLSKGNKYYLVND